MFLFFDRISPGAPKITGILDLMLKWNDGLYTKAFSKSRRTGGVAFNGNYHGPYFYYIDMDSSCCSSQYNNSVNEIRVKSIISNGYIKLF